MPMAPKDLHGLVDDFPGHLGGENFEHGDFAAHVAALIDFPRGVVGHQPAGVDARGRIGHPPLDGLALGQRHAEGHALRRIFAHHVERALRHADARAGHFEAPRRKPDLHRREAVSFLAEQLRFRHAAIFQRDFVGEMAADHRDSSQHVEAGRALVDQERRDAAARAFALVGDRHQDGEVGFARAADPDLAAVDHPVDRRP